MILGGKDLKAGGTWMACTNEGRLAFVTNYREFKIVTEKNSRGDLPIKFLESGKGPLEFAEDIAKEAHMYSGFNLILVDILSRVMVYVSNRPLVEAVSVQVVSPGLHVLTNASLNSSWPKAMRLRQIFDGFLHQHDDNEVPAKEMLEQLMGDRERAPMAEGVPDPEGRLRWEHERSSIFVETNTPNGTYGTRSQLALTVTSNSDVSLYEKYLEDNVWKEHTVEYRIKKLT